MPIRNTQQDLLLRMIQQLAAVAARLLELRGGGRLDDALEVAAEAEAELLGPLAAAATVVDTATAAQMIGEPLRIAAWSRLLRERAGLLREAGDAGGAEGATARARALAEEARARAVDGGAAVEAMLGGEPPRVG